MVMRIREGVLTVLHKGCGGQVLLASSSFPSYKTFSLKLDGTLGCCLCGKQPLSDEDTFQDYR